MQEDEEFFAPARRDGMGPAGTNLFAGGLKDYARHLANVPAGEEEEHEAGQRLAQRFVRRPPAPVHIPERPLVSAIAPYLAAAGFFVFAGTASALYFFNGDAQEWTVTGTARAAIGNGSKIDTALTSFAPKTIQEPTDDRTALREEENEPETPAAVQSGWTDTVEAFKALASPKTTPRQASADVPDASRLLKTVESWPKK